MLTWHDCITQLLRVRLIWCSLPRGLGLAQLCYGPLSWEHSLCWLLPEHTCSNNKMKLWWKSFFLQKCKVQVNTSSWHSQLCGLLLWHSAKVLTGFIKSFISKLYKKGKMVVGVWRKVSNICEASFPDRPQLSTYQYPVQRGVQCPGQCPHCRHLHTHPLLFSHHIEHTISKSSPSIWHSVTSLLHSE